MALLVKRKRSSDAVSDAGTGSITDASTPRRDTDEKSQLLALQRAQHAAAKLQLEGVLQQAKEQKTHVAAQLQQLEGCEGSTDLQQQLQTYERQEQQARTELAELESTFTAAVAGILGIAVEQGTTHLEAALVEQQHLQAAEVEQLAMEQQLAGRDFAVTDVSKHQGKRARLDRISQVWDWLQRSGGSGEVTSPTAPAATEAAAAARLASSEGMGSSCALQKSADALANGHGAVEQQQQQQQQQQPQEQSDCQKPEQLHNSQRHCSLLQEGQLEQQQQQQQLQQSGESVQQQQQQQPPFQSSGCQHLETSQNPSLSGQQQQGTKASVKEAEGSRQQSPIQIINAVTSPTEAVNGLDQVRSFGDHHSQE